MSKVENCDSSLISLVLCLIRLAKKNNITIKIEEVPNKLLELADLCNVRYILCNE